jgi:hypothetical protein
MKLLLAVSLLGTVESLLAKGGSALWVRERVIRLLAVDPEIPLATVIDSVKRGRFSPNEELIESLYYEYLPEMLVPLTFHAVLADDRKIGDYELQEIFKKYHVELAKARTPATPMHVAEMWQLRCIEPLDDWLAGDKVSEAPCLLGHEEKTVKLGHHKRQEVMSVLLQEIAGDPLLAFPHRRHDLKAARNQRCLGLLTIILARNPTLAPEQVQEEVSSADPVCSITVDKVELARSSVEFYISVPYWLHQQILDARLRTPKEASEILQQAFERYREENTQFRFPEKPFRIIHMLWTRYCVDPLYLSQLNSDIPSPCVRDMDTNTMVAAPESARAILDHVIAITLETV